MQLHFLTHIRNMSWCLNMFCVAYGSRFSTCLKMLLLQWNTTINTVWNIAYEMWLTCMFCFFWSFYITQHQRERTVNVSVCLFWTAVHLYICSKHCCHLIFLYRLTYAFTVNKERGLHYAFRCVICPLCSCLKEQRLWRGWRNRGKPLFQRALARRETSSSVRRCLSQTSQLTALMSLGTNLCHNSKQAKGVRPRPDISVTDAGFRLGVRVSLTLSLWPC